MVKIFVLKKQTLYIALAILLSLIIGIGFFIAKSGSDETFSETLKYAYKKISAEQAKVLIEKNENVMVIDLRNEEDFIFGHLPQATLLSYRDLKKNIADMDRDKIYMLYDEDEKDSTKAADYMSKKGFPKVYVLKGGFEKWPYTLE